MAVPAKRASYVPSASVQTNVAKFQHTGAIAKPLVSICGSSDLFITPANNAVPCIDAVNAAGKGSTYWQYLVSGDTYVDTFAPFGYGLQPQLPCAWAAFDRLVAIVERGSKPSQITAA